MNARKTWTIEGIDDEVREKAKDVAKRSGMSLGAWLNAVIADTAEQTDEPEEAPRKPAARRPDMRQDMRRDAELRRFVDDERDYLPRSRRDSALRRYPSEDFENLFGALETLARRVSSAEDQARAALAAADHRLDRPSREQDSYYDDDYDDISRALGSAQADLIAADDEARDALRTLISRTRTLRQGSQRGQNHQDDRRFSAIASSLGQLEGRLEEISHRLERGNTAAKPAAEAADGGLLSTIQQRLEELAARMDKAQEAPVSDKFATSINGLEAKLEALAERIERPIQPAPGIENSLKGLEDRFSELSRRLDTQPPTPAPVSDPVHTERLSRIEEQLQSLNTSLAKPAARTNEAWDEQIAWERDNETGDSDLASAIRQIAARQRTLENQLEPEVATRGFNNIEGQLRSLSERFETNYRPAIASDDIAALQRQVAELHQTISQSASETSIAAIYSEVRDLARKVDDVRAVSTNQDVLERIETKLAAIAQIAEQATPRETFMALDDKIAALARSLASSGASVDPATFDRITDHVDQVRKVVADAMPTDAMRSLQTEVRSLNVKIEELRHRPVEPTMDSIRALEGRMRDIAAMLETTHSPKVTQKLIEDIKAQIGEATRNMVPAANSAQNAALEGQLQDLASKVERMRGLDVDPRTLAGLESQIGRLAEQMSVSDKRFKSLEHIERTIGDVFTHIDANRNSTLEAAKIAASEAVRSAFNEGLPRIDPHTDGVIQTLQQNLADLRSMSDASDRRTAETLMVVNETMRKVADRLALLDGASQPALRAPQPAAQQALQAPPAQTPAVHAAAPQASHRPDPVMGTPEPAAPRAAAPRDARTAIAAAREAAAKAAQIKAEPSLGDRPLSADMPLEPGAGRPAQPADGASAARAARNILQQPLVAPPSEQDSRESFISAARRAAQAATAEAMAKLKPRKGEDAAKTAPVLQAASPAKPQAPAKPAKAKLFASAPASDLDDVLEPEAAPQNNRRKQIVMTMATLVIILGGYKLYGDFMGGAPALPPAPAKVVVTTEPTPAERAATTPQTTAPANPVAVINPTAPTTPVAKAPEAAQPEIATPAPAITEPAAKAVQVKLPAFPATLASPRLKAAAQNGDPRAVYEVGVRLIDGRGTLRDVQAGTTWLKAAGEMNHAPSLYRLANLYEKGAPGFAKDSKEAISLYEKAGALGNRKALHNVAALYAAGAEGKPNYEKAFPKFQRASELGLVDSQYNLAVLFVNGLGTPQNLAEGYKWFAIAAQNGDRDAGKKRDEIGTKLDGQGLVNARLAAQSFTPVALEPAANEEVAPAGTWDDLMPPARVSEGGATQAPAQLGIPVSASRKN